MSTAREQRIYHRLQVTARELQRAADQAIRPSGLSTAQLAVLAVIDADQPVRQRLIADRLSLTEQALTAMVGRLDALGYLERRPDPDDGRSWLLELSEDGSVALHAAGERFGVVNAAIESALTDRQLTELAARLDEIRASLRELQLDEG